MTPQTDRNQRGIVFNVQKYSLHDGPGIRTILFLKGCPLSCHWCCNPESQISKAQLAYNRDKCLGVDQCQRCQDICPHDALPAGDDGTIDWQHQRCDDCLICADQCPNHALNVYGTEMTVDQALARVEEDECFYARSGGGLTLSGGEPLLQHEFALALLREARRRRIDTCIETCGQVPWPVLEAAAAQLTSVMYDVKCIDNEKHARACGVGNRQILDNLMRLKKQFPQLLLTVRTPVIPGFNDSEAEIAAIIAFIAQLPHTRFELLAYHRMGTPKYAYLGCADPMAGIDPPAEERVQALRNYAQALRTSGAVPQNQTTTE